MKKIVINANINLFVTEETFQAFEDEKKNAYDNWLAELEDMEYCDAMAKELRKLERRLASAATREEWQGLWDVYSDMHKDVYGVRP